MNDGGDPYACMDCGARQPVGGPCRACRADPTLDLRDTHVREMLREDDVSRRSRRGDRIRYLSVLLDVIWPFRPRFPYLGPYLARWGPFTRAKGPRRRHRRRHRGALPPLRRG